MTDRTCPLGDGCDLTVAWMAGREEARDQFRARIERLETQLGLTRIDADMQRDRASAAEADARSLRDALNEVRPLVAGASFGCDRYPLAWRALMEGIPDER